MAGSSLRHTIRQMEDGSQRLEDPRVVRAGLTETRYNQVPCAEEGEGHDLADAGLEPEHTGSSPGG